MVAWSVPIVQAGWSRARVWRTNAAELGPRLVTAGVPLLGTSLDSIDLAEDRDRFAGVLRELNLRQIENGIAHTLDEAVEIAGRIDTQSWSVLLVSWAAAAWSCATTKPLRVYIRQSLEASDLQNAPF